MYYHLEKECGNHFLVAFSFVVWSKEEEDSLEGMLFFSRTDIPTKSLGMCGSFSGRVQQQLLCPYSIRPFLPGRIFRGISPYKKSFGWVGSKKETSQLAGTNQQFSIDFCVFAPEFYPF